MVNIDVHSDEFIFRHIAYCKSSQSYVLRGKTCLSYTRAREILLSFLESIGLDKRNFGLIVSELVVLLQPQMPVFATDYLKNMDVGARTWPRMAI
jgi:hypothetical protein